MKIEIKWLPDNRKRPVPAQYFCTVALENPPINLYSVVLTFPQQVCTWANLESLTSKDLVIGDDIFYITEGRHVVAEAHKYAY